MTVEPGAVEARLREVIAELSPDPVDLTPQTQFTNIDIDSLDLAEIAQAMLDEFGAEVPTETLEGARTVGELVKLITSHAA